MEAIMDFIVYVGEICFILGVPQVVLIFFLINLFKIIRLKNRNETVSKSLIKKAKICGAIFVAIVLFYALVMYLLATSVAFM